MRHQHLLDVVPVVGVAAVPLDCSSQPASDVESATRLTSSAHTQHIVLVFRKPSSQEVFGVQPNSVIGPESMA